MSETSAETNSVKVRTDVMMIVIQLSIHLEHVSNFCHFAYYLLDACEFGGYPEATLVKLRSQLALYDTLYLAPYESVVREFSVEANTSKVRERAKKCASLLHALLHDMRVLRTQLEAEKPIAAQCEPEPYSLKNSMNCFAALFKKLSDNCDKVADCAKKCVVTGGRRTDVNTCL